MGILVDIPSNKFNIFTPSLGANRVNSINSAIFKILKFNASTLKFRLNTLGILKGIPSNRFTIFTPSLGANRVKNIDWGNFEILNFNAMPLKFRT